MRILCLDYGKKRTGVAVTDPAGLIPQPLQTVETSALLRFLKDYTGREAVSRIVMGMPTQPNGQPSENQPRVLALAAKLRAALPQIPVEFYDTRFPSVLAHQAILEAGVKKQRRREDKGLVDEISACIILQSYMDAQMPY